MSIGDAKLDSVEYYFYNNKFAGAKVKASGIENFTPIVDVLSERFGTPFSADESETGYFVSWSSNDKLVQYMYFISVDQNVLLVVDLPVWNNMNEHVERRNSELEKKSNKEAADESF